MNFIFDWLGTMMVLAVIMLASALGFVAYHHFSEPWLVQGTWQPAESAWPRPALRYVPSYSVLAITTNEGWGFTPSHYFLDRAED